MKALLTSMTAMALALSAGATLASEGCDDGEIVMKFAHVTNADKHPKGIAASLFAERVNDEMNGKACMEVFPNSTLYDDDQVLEAMLQGDVQFAAPSLSKFEAFTKQFQIFDLPFMFKNIDAVDAFQNSETGEAMKESDDPSRPSGPGILAQRDEADVGQQAASAARTMQGPEVPRAALRRAGGADGGAWRHRRSRWPSPKSTAPCRPALSTVRRTPGRTSTARSSSRCRTASPRPTTACSTTWSWPRSDWLDSLDPT